jgi:hypothetical protein
MAEAKGAPRDLESNGGKNTLSHWYAHRKKNDITCILMPYSGACSLTKG